ncbi:MAG: hypothetical protein WBJ58_00875 [Syntrophales bacterium]
MDEDRICARCGHWYGSHDAGCAAERIAAMISGHPPRGFMPLTKTGKKVKKEMVKRYGKKKDEAIFYASKRKGIPGSKKWVKRKKK